MDGFAALKMSGQRQAAALWGLCTTYTFCNWCLKYAWADGVVYHVEKG